LKSIKKIIFISFLIIASVSFPVFAQYSENEKLNTGIQYFSSGKYNQSLSAFRDIIIDSSLKSYHPDAYFWIAKSYLALRQLDNAEENLEFFILNFRDNRFYQEALYQKGRLLFLQEDYENCIQESYSFIESYPDSPFAGNAYFWAAESLYALGRLEDAERLYSHVIYYYPSSYKVEAAGYRLSLIEQKYREESLVELLKLTHEEYLKSIEEFQLREKTYESAIDSYQKKLTLPDSGQAQSASTQSLSLERLELQSALRSKDNEIMALKRKIAELEYRLKNAETKVTEAEAKVIEVNPEKETGAAETAEGSEAPAPAGETLTTEDKLKLLEIKSRAQEVKSFYLKYLNSVGD
jgi:TolA-binding protein